MRSCLVLLVAAVACKGGAHAKTADASSDGAPTPDSPVPIDAPADAAIDMPTDAPALPPQPVLQGSETYVKASNTAAGDGFGYAIAISADASTLAVGAWNEATVGAVYVYVAQTGTWSQQALLQASNPQASAHFGYSLALAGDGSTLVVGAPNEKSCATGIDGLQNDTNCADAGAAYVFVRDAGGAWSQQAYVKASNTPYTSGNGHFFGTSLALASDGNTLAVGGPGDASPSTGIDNQQTLTTAPYSGAVYVFARTGTAWSQQSYLKASNTESNDEFGDSLAISGDGNTLLVGAPQEASGATGVNGSQLDNSRFCAGAAYLFARANSTWAQRAYLKASNTDRNDFFGYALAVSADATTLAVGAYGVQLDSGAAYVFATQDHEWVQQAYIQGSVSYSALSFGHVLALSSDGNTLAVGAPGDHGGGTGITTPQTTLIDASGSAFVFGRSETSWFQLDYVKASNPDVADIFGSSLALSGDARTLAVGAYQEDSNATGIGGNQADNSAANAGAAYIVQ